MFFAKGDFAKIELLVELSVSSLVLKFEKRHYYSLLFLRKRQLKAESNTQISTETQLKPLKKSAE